MNKKSKDLWDGFFDFDGDGETSPEEEWVGIKFLESKGSLLPEQEENENNSPLKKKKLNKQKTNKKLEK